MLLLVAVEEVRVKLARVREFACATPRAPLRRLASFCQFCLKTLFLGCVPTRALPWLRPTVLLVPHSWPPTEPSPRQLQSQQLDQKYSGRSLCQLARQLQRPAQPRPRQAQRPHPAPPWTPSTPRLYPRTPTSSRRPPLQGMRVGDPPPGPLTRAPLPLPAHGMETPAAPTRRA